jgi:signal transduction histidine kinase
MTPTERTVVLIVEDHEPTRYARLRTFRQAGFDVLEASTGTEGLRLVAEKRPDIVVCDVNLPDISGLEVCQRIKADPATATVLVLHLTASSPEVRKRIAGFEAGADSYLVEPVDPDELVASVRALRRLQRAEEAARAAATEAEQRRREAEAARAEAEAANRAKDEFLATLSHELRTPLNAIVGWLHVLRSDRIDDATRRRGLDTIDRNVRAQAQLIDDLLDMSRIVTGRLRLELTLIDIEPVVRGAVEAFMPAAQAKGIRLDAVVDREVGAVRGDADRLQQIVSNLLSNALKFTPADGRVTVAASRAGTHIEVAVRDTGIGIPPDFLPHVFDRFRQADASTTRAHTGLGLGLTIARQLAELHGGSLRAESPGVGGGATFTLVLPGGRADRRGAAVGETLGAPAPSARTLAGVSALVVDDDRDARELLATILRAAGADVTAVGSAPEALTTFTDARPDVLVADIAMPGEDGRSLIRRVRALPPERGGAVPALALTAYARGEDLEQSLAAGFHSHLTKPLDPDELIREIARLVRRAPPSR